MATPRCCGPSWSLSTRMVPDTGEEPREAAKRAGEALSGFARKRRRDHGALDAPPGAGDADCDCQLFFSRAAGRDAGGREARAPRWAARALLPGAPPDW
eukprot:9112858-Pyramimonas_sp.AAC.1